MEQVIEVFRLLGFPSIRRPNGTCKGSGNSFIIAYLGQIRRASSAWGSVRISVRNAD